MKTKMKNKAFLPVLTIIVMIISLSIFFAVSFGTTSFTAEAFSNNSVPRTFDENVNISVEIFGNKMSKINNTSNSGFSSGDSMFSQNVNYSNGGVVLCDSTFAGAFVDENGILNIGVVGLQDIATGYSGQVIYIPQSYNWNSLLGIQEELMTSSLDFGIVKSRTNEITNRVEVFLYCLSVSSKINYVFGANNKNILYFKEVAEDKIALDSTMYGGDRLNTSNWLGINTFRGTMTANAICNETGRFGILTNQHVAVHGTMHSDGWLGTSIGNMDPNRNQFGGTLDAAFVPFSNQSNWSTTSNARFGNTTYTNIRLGDEGLILTGLPVRRIGQTTGITTGTITSRSTGFRMDGEDFYSIIEYSNAGQGGDSGGPLYFDAGNQGLFLIGMHFASTLPQFQNRWGYASRISEVIRIFNVTPITNGTIFNTTDLPNNEIRINNLDLTWPADPNSNRMDFTIPSEINGRTVTELGNFAFANQPNITNFILPNNLRIIGNSAFANNLRLGILGCIFVIPPTVTHIGAWSFSGNRGLWQIELPLRLEVIGHAAFYNTGLRQLVIPNRVLRIEQFAFFATDLSSVVIPSSVDYIGIYAFAWTRGARLTAVTMRGISPPVIDSTTFYGKDRANIMVLVPFGLSEVYESAGWIGFNLVERQATIITNQLQLSAIRYNPNGHFILGNDVILTGQWLPITQLGPYGVLDGNGRTISGLTITGRTVAQTGVNVGLFAINHGEIRNLRMTGVYIIFGAEHGSAWSNTGAIAGINRGRIENVVVAGRIEVHRENSCLGGIAGQNLGVIESSQVGLLNQANSIVLFGNGDVGGTAGANLDLGTISRSSLHNGRISFYWNTVNRSVGGVVGYNDNARIYRTRVYNTLIRYANPYVANDHRRPYMGLIAGAVHAFSQIWHNGVVGVTLYHGSLIGPDRQNQRINVGNTRYWNWGGREYGVNHVIM